MPVRVEEAPFIAAKKSAHQNGYRYSGRAQSAGYPHCAQPTCQMKTDFDLWTEADPLRHELSRAGGTAEFWPLLEGCNPRIHIQPPASTAEIDKLRRFAGGSLPPTLEAFLAHSNGLSFDYDSIVLPIDRIIQLTDELRGYDGVMPMDSLLFIGELGDGDMFAFGQARNGEWLPDVYWWEHETDSRYVCGAGIWGYVAAHISWCIVSEDDSSAS